MPPAPTPATGGSASSRSRPCTEQAASRRPCRVPAGQGAPAGRAGRRPVPALQRLELAILRGEDLGPARRTRWRCSLRRAPPWTRLPPCRLPPLSYRPGAAPAPPGGPARRPSPASPGGRPTAKPSPSASPANGRHSRLRGHLRCSRHREECARRAAGSPDQGRLPRRQPVLPMARPDGTPRTPDEAAGGGRRPRQGAAEPCSCSTTWSAPTRSARCCRPAPTAR